MFDFWNNLSGTMKLILTICFIVVILVIIVLIMFVCIHFKNKHKEGYVTKLTTDNSKDSSLNALTSYVSGWIDSVKGFYNGNSVNESYAQPRTLKKFDIYRYLPKTSIITGKSSLMN